jgi:hypothetical protein
MRQEPPAVVQGSNPSATAFKQGAALVSDDDNDDITDETYEMPRYMHNHKPSADSGFSNEGIVPRSLDSVITTDPSAPLEPNRRPDIESGGPPERTRVQLRRIASPKNWIHPTIKNFESPLSQSFNPPPPVERC